MDTCDGELSSSCYMVVSLIGFLKFMGTYLLLCVTKIDIS